MNWLGWISAIKKVAEAVLEFVYLLRSKRSGEELDVAMKDLKAGTIKSLNERYSDKK